MTSRRPRDLSINKDSGVAPYEQIREQVTLKIFRGELEPDAKLPTTYELHNRLGLSTKTVARAYRELQRDGLVYTESAGTNAGTYVAGPPEQGTSLTSEAARYAARAHEQGLTLGQASIVLAQQWPREPRAGGIGA